MPSMITQTLTGRIRLARLLTYPERKNIKYTPCKMSWEQWNNQAGALANEVVPGQEMETAKWMQQIPNINIFFYALSFCKAKLRDADAAVDWNKIQRKLMREMKKYLPYLRSLKEEGEVAVFLSAYAGATSSDAEELFWNLDRECMRSKHTRNRADIASVFMDSFVCFRISADQNISSMPCRTKAGMMLPVSC